jgi:predicted transcriptional regulator YheO
MIQIRRECFSQKGDPLPPHIENIEGLAEAIAESVSTALGGSFEIILYDLTQAQQPVLRVLGKNISGLAKGDSGRDENFNSTYSQCRKENRIYRSEKRIINGREMRSTVVFFTDDSGRPAAALKINFDLSIVSLMEGFLKECGMLGGDNGKTASVRDIDVRSILPSLLKEGIQSIGKDVPEMSREDKLRIIRLLDERGAFLLRNSIEDAAKALDITRFTVYNYLDEIRRVRDG